MKLSLFSRRSRLAPARPTQCGIEPLEDRIAPASLVSPTEVTFLNKNGDNATVTISKGLFTAANVAKVFTFDSAFATGSSNGINSVAQQLEMLNISKLGPNAAGLTVTITATTVSNGPGTVDVGYINSTDIDLGTVTVGGDLGRIHVGDTNLATPALTALVVQSMGADGTTTQATGGNLTSNFLGAVGSITVNGSIDGAALGIGGSPSANLGSLLVTGNIDGSFGSTIAPFAGSVRTQGGITTAVIDGNLIGGPGASSGIIGTSGKLGSVTVKGYVQGAGGAFSGAILSTGAMGNVEVYGDLIGGAGANSGQIGTAAKITGSAKVDSSIFGGSGALSGTILAGHGINSVVVTNGLIGGTGANSGQIGSGGNITSVQVGTFGIVAPGLRPLDGTFQGIEGGSGNGSGTIVAAGDITTVTIGGDVIGYNNEEIAHRPAFAISKRGKEASGGGGGAGTGVISAAGNITTVNITGSVIAGGILSGGTTGSITIGGNLSDYSEIDGSGGIGSVSVNVMPQAAALVPEAPFQPNGDGPGISDSSILSDHGGIGSISAGGQGEFYNSAIGEATIKAAGSIGPITAVNTNGAAFAIDDTTVTAGGAIGDVFAISNDGTAIYFSTFVAGKSIGNITATNSTAGSEDTAVEDGILDTSFRAGGDIASITAYTADVADNTACAISGGAFDAGGNIGPINATGALNENVFIAGIDLPGISYNSTDGGGTFDMNSAPEFGFGSSTSAVPAHIGTITVNAAGEGGLDFIAQTTFLAGVHGAGGDHTFGTKDDNVATGSTVGQIIAPGGLNTVFVESGSIGATMSGQIADTNYIATDTAVSAGGIGPITVNAYLPVIDTLIVHAGGATPAVVAHPQFASVNSDGISSSTFISNAGIDAINVTIYGQRNSGENSGIDGSSFTAGHAIADITVTNNAYGPDGTNYGINTTHFNAGLNGNGGVGDINVQLTDSAADGNSTVMNNVTVNATVCYCMAGNIGSIYAYNADTTTSSTDTDNAVPAGIVDSVFRAYGDIGDISATMQNGDITAPAIQGSLFSAYGSIGAITVYGAVVGDATASRFLAGYDVGADMVFGVHDLTAKLQGGQMIGNVTVSGYFSGSDIAASVNPGAAYVFGDTGSGVAANDNTNVGAGGTIGLVVLGTEVPVPDGPLFVSDQPTQHAIEAETFTLFTGKSFPGVMASGIFQDIPTVLYVDGGSDDVRITNLAVAV